MEALVFFEIFVGLVLFISFVGVLVDEAPDKIEKKKQEKRKSEK